MFVSLVVMLVYTLTIWARSIEFIFIASGETRVLSSIYFITIFCQACDAGVKQWLLFKEGRTINFREIIASTYSNIISIVYLCICVIGISDKANILWWFLEGFNIYYLYVRASEIYQELRLKNFALKFEYQFKLFDLILNLIILAHIFVLIFLYRQWYSLWLATVDYTKTVGFWT